MYKFYCLFIFTVYELAAGAAQNDCVLPEYPPHGIYTVYNRPKALPGQTYYSAFLKVTCDPGYGVVGIKNMYCFRNVWNIPMPQCIRFCRLTPDPSVNYKCKITEDGVENGTRLCHELEPHGTVVVPECNRPVYNSSSPLLNMQCVDGTWDHVAVCQPVYGSPPGATQNEPDGCVLPEFPPHGTYTVYNKPEAVPGKTYDSAILKVTCDPGYGVVGSNVTYCYSRNVWQLPMPQCVRFCRLTPDPSVNYKCKITEAGVVNGMRLCHELEPHGTVVVPECNRPVYNSSSPLLNMQCVDGTWDHVTVCQPVYGSPPGATQNETNGCVLPKYPPHGTYAVYRRPDALPGQTYDSADLTVTCDPGYGVVGSKYTFCSGSNVWQPPMPQCVLNRLAEGATQNQPDGCVLPEYPPHGTYTVYNRPEAVPGQTYDSAILTVTCDSGYGVVGSNGTYCISRNVWQQPMPQCVRFCRLTPDPSVNYKCKITEAGVVNGMRLCHELEPHGTVVVPECNRPVYYSSSALLNMHCVDGTWDHVAVCQPDCGTSTPSGEPLIYNGTRTPRGELPWHAGIYEKTFVPFKQICSGSLISTKVIISAAHCFWKEGKRQEAAGTYAVALGKIYRAWDDAGDDGAHKSDVSEIKIPVRYLGEAARYQEDIALVFMSTPVVYRTYIRPVCIDFSNEFDKIQLQSTNSGRVSGWGLTSPDGLPSPVLMTAELPYVDLDKCIAEVPREFRPYISSDKFCAGISNGTGVCPGDSGGGLVFPNVEQGIRRYYLRGVVAPGPMGPVDKCNINAYTILTHIQSHAEFIRDHVPFSSNS